MRAAFAFLVVWVFAALPLAGQDIPTRPGNILYGQSCRDRAVLFYLAAPVRGLSLDYIVDVGDGEPRAAVAWLGIGFNKSRIAIGKAQGQTCWLLVAPSWVVPIALVDGYAARSLLRVPRDPALKGLPLFAQLLYDSPRFGLALSRGVQMSVQ